MAAKEPDPIWSGSSVFCLGVIWLPQRERLKPTTRNIMTKETWWN
jgi:hypothetical protein